VLLYLAWLAQDRGQYDEASALTEESAAICREIGDKLGLGWALSRLGAISWWAGDPPAARLLLQQGLALCREVDDKYGLVEWLMMLTAVLLSLEEYGQTVETAKEGVLRCRELGARRNLSQYLYMAGIAVLLSGDAPDAGPWLREALLNARDVGEKMTFAQALMAYGMLCLAQARPAMTLRLGGASVALTEAGGFGWPKYARLLLDQTMSAARQALAPEAAEAAWLQGQTMPLDELIAEALEEEVSAT
jgi:tetratricopeptide (TPR) repeat protein